jgi:hypothetical protein
MKLKTNLSYGLITGGRSVTQHYNTISIVLLELPPNTHKEFGKLSKQQLFNWNMEKGILIDLKVNLSVPKLL